MKGHGVCTHVCQVGLPRGGAQGVPRSTVPLLAATAARASASDPPLRCAGLCLATSLLPSTGHFSSALQNPLAAFCHSFPKHSR